MYPTPTPAHDADTWDRTPKIAFPSCLGNLHVLAEIHLDRYEGIVGHIVSYADCTRNLGVSYFRILSTCRG
jgi:hypothetical protein